MLFIIYIVFNLLALCIFLRSLVGLFPLCTFLLLYILRRGHVDERSQNSICMLVQVCIIYLFMEMNTKVCGVRHGCGIVVVGFLSIIVTGVKKNKIKLVSCRYFLLQKKEWMKSWGVYINYRRFVIRIERWTKKIPTSAILQVFDSLCVCWSRKQRGIVDKRAITNIPSAQLS